MEKQSRSQSALFWLGLVACIYQAIYGSLTASGLSFAPVTLAVLGAVSVGLSALLVYCNGNNPSLTTY